jgi:hypothetical protein
MRLGYRGEASGAHEYRLTLQDLYSSVARVASADIVVDSTKDPVYLRRLARVPSLDVAVVHLVRDPRGVASALKKVVRRPELVTSKRPLALMPRSGVTRASAEWLVDNVLVELSAINSGPRIRLMYEQFAASPEREFSELLVGLGLADRGGDQVDQLKDNGYSAAAWHSIGGNPIQFRRGRIRIDVDDRWKTNGLTRRELAIASSMTFPLRRRYGYD